VDEQTAAAEHGGKRQAEVISRLGKTFEHAMHRIVRCCRRLEHVQSAIVVLHNQVGEGSPSIDGKPHLVL
jgi:hypothetical protein